jgi:hypothetical protein
MSDNHETRTPVILGKRPAEGGIRTPDPRITNGAPEAGNVLRGLGFEAAGNTLEGHPALRLMPMPAEEGAESLADFMLMRRDRCMAGILDRVRAARESGAGFSLGDLTLMLHEAWTGGGAAMSDGITARESMRSLELMDAMEAETDRQRVRQAVTEMPAFALPWPGEAGLMSLLKGEEGR